MFDLGKAVVGSKDDDIKVASKRLMYRAIAGVLIFFVPTVVMWLFGLSMDTKICQLITTKNVKTAF